MFKRTVAFMTILTAMLCFTVNAEPVQSPDTFGTVQVEYTARDSSSIGNGNGANGGFHNPVWPVPEDLTTPPQTKPPVTPQVKPPDMPSETYNVDDEWLIYWYICGTNLETDYSEATNDIREMEAVKLPPNVKILIQTGTTGRWHHDIIKRNGDGIYLYDSSGLKKISDYTSDMYKAETLTNFLNYGEKNYSNVDHRILIFWDHGGVDGVCYEHGTGLGLRLDALKSAVGTVYGNAPQRPPFEIIGFDACIMGSYESANTVNGFARYMVASEANENENGWYYTDWLNELADNPATEGSVLCQKICSGSLQHSGNNNATFAALDMKNFYTLRKAHEAYFTEALNRAKSSPAFITNFASIIKGNDTRVESYSGVYMDLKSMASNTLGLLPETSKNLISAIDNVIVGEPQNGSLRRGGGVSTYYPYSGYVRREFTESNASFVNQKEFYNAVVGGSRYRTYTNQSSEKKSFRTASGFNVAALSEHLVTIENNQAVTRLTPKELESVSEVSCLIVQNVEDPNSEVGTRGEASVIVGSNIAVKADRQNGIFRSHVKGTWPAIDGHIISIERTFATNEYELYESPILLNGEPRLMQISYNNSAGKYNIEGMRKYVSEKGISDRESDVLKAGDEITPLFLTIGSATEDDGQNIIYRFYNEDGDVVVIKLTTGIPFKIGNNPTIAEKMFNTENVEDYNYTFVFHAPDGTAAWSESVYFTISDEGEIHFFKPEKLEE